MRRLPRRLALWGGAAAIAGGGFAFMASNSVAATGAGEGSGAVSGYTVSNVSYNGGGGSGCGGTTGCYISSVSFTLASKTGTHTSQAYTMPPKFVRAALTGSTGSYLDSSNCTVTGTPWATGHAKFVCDAFGIATNTGYKTNAVRIKNVYHLDVTATQ